VNRTSLGLAAILLVLGASGGCETSSGVSVSGSMYYGLGYYDPYYRPGYYPPVVIVPPPSRPSHPIERPTIQPTPRPMPSIPSTPRPARRR
jgi:hypothetical protein